MTLELVIYFSRIFHFLWEHAPCQSDETWPSYPLHPWVGRGPVLSQGLQIMWYKYWDEHWGRPSPILGRHSSRQSGVLARRPNQWYGRYWSTGRFRCRSRVPISHRYRHPQNCYTNGHRGSWNQVQTAHDQQAVLARNLNLPPITKVMSGRQPVLSQGTPTCITPSQATTHLQYQTTTHNSQHKSTNLSKFTRKSG